MGRKEFLDFMREEIKLTKLIEEITKIRWDDEKEVYFDRDNNILEWTDYEMIDLPNSIPYKDEENDVDDYIDGVLYFGDGTIEFHFQECMDAENWARFDIEIMRKVIAELETL